MAWRCFAGFVFVGAFPGLALATLPTGALEGRLGPLVLLWAFALGLGCAALVTTGRSEKVRGGLIAGAVACVVGMLLVLCAKHCLSLAEVGRAGADAEGWLPRNVLASGLRGVLVSFVSLVILALVWALAFWVERLRGREGTSAASAPALRIERGERL